MEVQRSDGVPGVAEIPEVPDDLTGVEAPLEHLGPGAERQRVQPGTGVVGVGDGLDREQGAVGGGVDVGAGPVLRCLEHPLHDGQLMRLGGGAGDAVIDGYVADEQDVEALVGDAAADEVQGGGAVGGSTGRYKAVGDTEVPCAQRLPGDRAEELHRQVDTHTRAVADALRGCAAPVRDGAECLVALDDDVMARYPVETGEKADAAVAVVAGRVVETEGGVIHGPVL